MKILSIDGGGIKGLLTASFFATLEKRFGSENRSFKLIGDYFELIVGTSTGGIIALALAGRIPASKIVNFYTQYGPLIFKKRKVAMFSGKCYGAFKSMYGNNVLLEGLKEVFGEKKTLKEMYDKNHIAVCVTATNTQNCKPFVFKTPHHPKLLRQLDTKIWEVAFATSAAPLFFPIARLETDKDLKYLADGGLWANNPSIVALTEAMGQFFNKKMEDLCLFSVGNISSYSALHDFSNLDKGLLRWRKNIVTMTLDSQAANAHYVMGEIFHGNEKQYLRIEDFVQDAEQLASLSQLDNVTECNMSLLINRGEQLASEFAVKEIFNHYFPK